MRRLSWLAVLAFAACDSGPNEGAVLTFETPDGPMTASRLEVILANAAADSISEVASQRREPGSVDDDAVRYYRQRVPGGTIEGTTAVAGFQLRIEPDLATSKDETFIPIVFAYDAERLIGVGVIEDANGDPARAQITPGTVTSYTVTMGAVRVVDDDDAAVGHGTARVVTCQGRDTAAGAPWRSGVAWFPTADPARPNGRTHQLRLLLPDVAATPLATDATARAADLDCDAHPADASDCDDLRGAFYDGAADTCDGRDTNCDSQRYVPQPCTVQNALCSIGPTPTGVQLCDDEAGTLGACTASAECLCAPGNPATSCIQCTVDFVGSGGMKSACTPSIGKIKLPMCEVAESCTVEVAAATTGWRGYLGTLETGTFTTKLTGIHGSVFLEVKREGSLPVSASSVGEVYLIVTTTQGPVTVPVQMLMTSQATACQPIAMGSGSKMICSP